MQAVQHVLNKGDYYLPKLGIPESQWDFIAESWRRKDPHLYGRFDLAYSGNGPAKLLEYNADTPTSLFESGHFQWTWLEDMIERRFLPTGTDQLNSIHEKLVERFKFIMQYTGQDNIHFAAIADSEEDKGTVETMAWAAVEAGAVCWPVDIEDIGASVTGQFVDDHSRVMGTLFKLYPWEDIFQGEYAGMVKNSGTHFIEPVWKSILSNKGILAVLWEMFPDHPNLLPTFFNLQDGSAVDKMKAYNGFYASYQRVERVACIGLLRP
jgi:glutathionylspermidine synthase